MSADRLREAARVLRERAEAATPGSWEPFVLGSEGYDIRARIEEQRRPVRVARCGYEEWDVDKGNAAYIATVAPPFALAVADWLDKYADILPETRMVKRPAYSDLQHALAVADTILGATQ